MQSTVLTYSEHQHSSLGIMAALCLVCPQASHTSLKHSTQQLRLAKPQPHLIISSMPTPHAKRTDSWATAELNADDTHHIPHSDHSEVCMPVRSSKHGSKGTPNQTALSSHPIPCQRAVIIMKHDAPATHGCLNAVLHYLYCPWWLLFQEQLDSPEPVCNHSCAQQGGRWHMQ
jgi:hypothetical protein